MEEAELFFEVHPSVIFKLGEDLITDDYQALVELAKNAYDADATKAQIHIWTKRCYALVNGEYQETDEQSVASGCEVLRGMIEVSDNGCGMTLDDIARGWLMVSGSHKKHMKERGETTSSGRVPLGDKGLGRLGAQRLGNVIELCTKAESSIAHRVIIDWRRFETDAALSSIALNVDQAERPKKHGTILRIYGLRYPDSWIDEVAVQNEFAKIVSPYSRDFGLSIALFINGTRIDLLERPRSLLAYSVIHYDLEYKNGVLDTVGYIKDRYLSDLRKKENLERWKRLVKEDGGQSFFVWLGEERSEQVAQYGLSYDGTDWFCRTHFSITLDEMPGMERHNGVALDPGSFTSSVDFVFRYTEDGRISKDTRMLLDSMSGIRFYRDGFGIRLTGEVFPFSEQWTSGASFYTLRPDNILGYVNLSAKDNSSLVETTDREGFVDNSYYRNFVRLLSSWVSKTEEVQSFLRRNYRVFEKKHDSDASGSPVITSRSIADAARGSLDAVKEELLHPRLAVNPTERTPISLIDSSIAAVNALEQQALDAEEELDKVWELAGLGIIAESVSHEMNGIATRLIDKSSELDSYNISRYNDSTITGIAALIRSIARSLRTQVSHLDPAMRYVRDVKEVFTVSSFASEWTSYMSSRTTSQDIVINLSVNEDFSIRMNRGRLLQVFDNLYYNAEYWLHEEVRNHHLEHPTFNVTVDSPYLRFDDNGRGVSRLIEASLFDPFVSNKPQGRGLGLYISRRLLELEGAKIGLGDTRNAYGNLYMFIIEFSNIVK